MWKRKEKRQRRGNVNNWVLDNRENFICEIINLALLIIITKWNSSLGPRKMKSLWWKNGYKNTMFLKFTNYHYCFLFSKMAYKTTKKYSIIIKREVYILQETNI